MLKRILFTTLLIASLPALADQKTGGAVPAATPVQKFNIDNNHTQVTFTYDHFGFSNPSARLEQIKGSIELNQQDWSKSSVAVTMPLAGLHTGVEKLDAHLKSADFFDAQKNPDITFKSTKVEKAGSNTLKVTGDLTAHGVTKPAVLDVNINKVGEQPMAKRAAAGFDATTTLKRSEFGIGKYVPNVSDEVKIRITTEAIVPKK